VFVAKNSFLVGGEKRAGATICVVGVLLAEKYPADPQGLNIVPNKGALLPPLKPFCGLERKST
jgi:hypothetical protein